MGHDNSKNQTNNELSESRVDTHMADHISEMQGTSVDQLPKSRVQLKVKDNNIVSSSQPVDQVTLPETCDTVVQGMSTRLQYINQSAGDKEVYTGLQKQQCIEMDTGVQQISVANDNEATAKSGTELNLSVTSDTDKLHSAYDEDEPFKKSMYNVQSVFPSQDGKESWQDDDGCISNIFPPADDVSVQNRSPEDVSVQNRSPEDDAPVQNRSPEDDVLVQNRSPKDDAPVQHTLDDSFNEKPFIENKETVNVECQVEPATTSLLQDKSGDNHKKPDQDCDPSTTEPVPVTNVNGISPTLQDAYTEFQALFSYVNDLKLSNRRLMKKLTEEQQRYKKTFEDSEAKVSGLEECVNFLEERVDQREGQIRKLKDIIQVLLQKVSVLSSALGDLPGDNGWGQESGALSSSLSEEDEVDEKDLEKKYMLPKPMTDKPKTTVIPSKHQLGYRGTKVTAGTDNRAHCKDEISSKVLRRAVRERSKASPGVVGKATKSSDTSSNRGTVHDQKGRRSQTIQKDKMADQNETKKSEANVEIPKTREPKTRKRPPRQVPIQNEFRNTLTEVTNMTKELSSNPRPYSMDLNSWIAEANIEIVKGAESTAPTGRGPNIVLCLDISQSMEGPPFIDMIKGVLQYIDGVENIRFSLGFQINIAIVTFGHKTEVLHHLTNDLSVLRESVRNLTTGGTSPLTAALLLSTAASIGHGHGVTTGGYVQRPRIIIFTDGRATLESILLGEDIPIDGDFSYEVMSNMLSVVDDIKKRKLTISYVPVGDFYPRYMEQIADRTGGKRYPMEQIDRAIRHSKNFAFAVKLMHVIKEATGGNLKDDHANRLILTSVASNDPFVTKDDEEDILEIVSKVDDLEKSADSDSDNDEGHRELEHDMLPLGTRVRRGPDWSWDDQDSNMAGTVVSHKSDEWLWVIWDNGHRNQYCFGRGGKYDVIPVDEPRILKPGETIQVGCMVKRGPDWKNGNKDGGEGSMGNVLHVYPNKTVLVRWPTKEILDHNYGCDGMFEVTLCDPSEQLALMMQASYGGGATGGATAGVTDVASWGTTGSSTRSHERKQTPEKENDDYISKLNRLNQRNLSSLEKLPSSELPLSSKPSQSENVPRKTQEMSSGEQSSSDSLAQSEIAHTESLCANVPHSEKSLESSSTEQNDIQSTDHRLGDNSGNMTEGSCKTGHSDGLTDNITGHNSSVAKKQSHNSNSGGKQDLPNGGDKTNRSFSGTKPTSIQPEGRSEDKNTGTDAASLSAEGPADAAAETEDKVTWQYKDEYGGWTCYSDENSKKIEKTFKSNRGMTVINGGKHRILLAKMIQVHTTTKNMTAIRRQVK